MLGRQLNEPPGFLCQLPEQFRFEVAGKSHPKKALQGLFSSWQVVKHFIHGRI